MHIQGDYFIDIQMAYHKTGLFHRLNLPLHNPFIHYRKFNIFIYGCENRRHSDKFLKEQVYPLMLHKNTAEKFSFDDCK